jgi:hypothetical protein
VLIDTKGFVMNKLLQKIALTTLASGSILLPLAVSPAQARPAEAPYNRTEVEVRSVSYLPTYIRTSEYCETNNTRFSGVWTRRGSSPVYDAVWTDYRGEKYYGTVQVVENNNGLLTLNYRSGNNSGYYRVRYDARDSISGTWRADNGSLWGSLTAFVEL